MCAWLEADLLDVDSDEDDEALDTFLKAQRHAYDLLWEWTRTGQIDKKGFTSCLNSIKRAAYHDAQGG